MDGWLLEFVACLGLLFQGDAALLHDSGNPTNTLRIEPNMWHFTRT